jgi:hypothetical protein
MTCNQAITLLELYRSSTPDKVATPDDLDKLRMIGLIEPALITGDKIIPCPEGDRWLLTAKGRDLVEKFMAMGQTIHDVYDVHFYDNDGVGFYDNIPETRLDLVKSAIVGRGGVVTGVIKLKRGK